MSNKSLTRTVLFFLSCCIYTYAAQYTILSLQPASAKVSFALENYELKNSSSKTTLFFAVPSQPAVSITADLSETYGISCAKNCLTPLSNGWMGNRFLQWFSLSIRIDKTSHSSDTPAGGILLFTFNEPIIKSGSRRSTNPSGYHLIDLPVKKRFLKRASISKPEIPYTVGVRMEVSEDGIYQITGSDLKSCGVPIERVPLQSYRLYCRDTEIPLSVSNIQHTYLEKDDIILFYGQILPGDTHHFTQYSYTNIYWLTWGGTSAGVRVAEASGVLMIDPYDYNPDIILKAKVFTDTLHCEIDNGILWQGDVFTIEETGDAPLTEDDIDNWYWGAIGFDKLSSFKFNILSPVNNTTFSLTLALTGLTSINTILNDHQYSISLNNKAINANAIWDGQEDYELVVHNISSELLTHGINTITMIRNQIDTIPDRGAFNWLDITYTRGFNSFENKITFKNNDKDINRWVQFDLTNFSASNLELWDISKYRKFKDFNIYKVTGKYSLSFQDSITSTTRYYAQAIALRQKPQNMTLDTIHDNWDFPSGVDYIIITTNSFIRTLQPLIDVHTESGLQVVTIDLQDIYNRFSYGLHNPESIRSMLKYVYNKHITDPPKYLLLAGDASNDMDKNDPYKSVNIVPTHLTRVPNWGPSATDDYFATVYGNDNFPDLYVGRFPAQNEVELKTCVTKTVQYLKNQEHGYWRDNLILIGGYEPEFTEFNNEVVSDIVGPKMHIFRMDADPESPFYTSGTGASDKLAGFINAGAYAIHFSGHGGGNTWSDSKFFSYSDLPKLHNSQWSESGRLPIIFSFTCLTGFFESNLYSSLGEEFLRQSKNGCISFYGASAYTRRNIDIRMARTLQQNAMSNSYNSLGELLGMTELLMLVMNASEALPLTRQYNLLGDPALPWRLTPDTLSLTLSNTNLKGSDTLLVTGNTSPIISGNVKLSVTAEHTVPWGEIIVTVTGGTFNHAFKLKKTSQTAHGLVRAYVWNDSTEIFGWKYFSKDTFALFDVAIAPPEPSLGDSVSISCRMESYDSLYNPIIICVYTIDNPQSQNFNFSSQVFMLKDSVTGLWYSEGKIPTGSSDMQFDINKYLILQFRATGNLGASDYFSFNIKGRPDLTFTDDTLTCSWQNDSLSVVCEVLNKGNAPAPSFSVAFFNRALRDTIFLGTTTGSLLPGKITRFNFAIPDTQGTITYSGLVNFGNTVEEINYSNNSAILSFAVNYADLFSLHDTLYSKRGGCLLTPADTLTAVHRVFLFTDTLEGKPLSSASAWLPLLGDGLSKFHIFARPALTLADTLLWQFDPVQISDSGTNTGVYYYDTISSQWQNRGGILNTTTNTISYLTYESGPFAIGTSLDNAPPEIRVYVSGKEILFLDYAAKNKPFNIFITDSSGIDKSSIRLLLNHTSLESDYKSSAVTGENLSTVILTAYPQKMNVIDSLTIIAKDNAGNRAERVFAYRPGEKLKIRFFSCHPNPFTAKPGKVIRFPFLLTDVATSVKLTIYTISGRKVWTWKSPSELIGYHEIAWDGTTLNRRNQNMGYRIANGTYYAKLVAKNKNRKVQKIIRIAKLEGY